MTRTDKSDEKITSSPAAPGIQDLLESLKNDGVQSALFRKDGGLVSSTIHMDDVTASMLSSIGNVSDTLLQRLGDASREVEFVMDNDLIVLVPLKSHYLCGILKSREQKKTLREYAEKLGNALTVL